MNLYKRILLDTKLYKEIIPTTKKVDGFINVTSFDLLNDKEIIDTEENNNIYSKIGNKKVLDVYKSIKKDIDKLDTSKMYVLSYKESDNYYLNVLYDLITLYKIKDKKEKYHFVYNKICDELDSYFINYNLCDFQDNHCVAKRELIGKFKEETLQNGCCYTKGRVCPFFINGVCTKRCIADKIFTCRYLKRKGIRFRVTDFLLLKEILNIKGLYLVDEKLFHDEEEMYKILIDKKGFK